MSGATLQWDDIQNSAFGCGSSRGKKGDLTVRRKRDVEENEMGPSTTCLIVGLVLVGRAIGEDEDAGRFGTLSSCADGYFNIIAGKQGFHIGPPF